MNFGNLGFMEILMILVALLLLFGAKRLPEIGASMGKGIRDFKRSLSDVDKAITEPARDVRSERLGASEQPLRTADEAQQPEPKRLLQ